MTIKEEAKVVFDALRLTGWLFNDVRDTTACPYQHCLAEIGEWCESRISREKTIHASRYDAFLSKYPKYKANVHGPDPNKD